MNEAQTRIKLIDDELIKCGWNIEDITKVVEEYEIELDDDLERLNKLIQKLD